MWGDLDQLMEDLETALKQKGLPSYIPIYSAVFNIVNLLDHWGLLSEPELSESHPTEIIIQTTKRR